MKDFEIESGLDAAVVVITTLKRGERTEGSGRGPGLVVAAISAPIVLMMGLATSDVLAGMLSVLIAVGIIPFAWLVLKPARPRSEFTEVPLRLTVGTTGPAYRGEACNVELELAGVLVDGRFHRFARKPTPEVRAQLEALFAPRDHGSVKDVPDALHPLRDREPER